MANNILGVDLKVDQEYIGKCIEQIIKSSMIEALDMKNQFVEECVKNILTQKVDGNGKPSNSSWDKDTLLEYHLRKVVEEATREEMVSIIEEKKEQIRELIKKELNKKSTLDDFVKSFFTNVEDSIANQYCTKINVDFRKRDSY